jgi:hypothetical protein
LAAFAIGIIAIAGYTPEYARRVAGTLLPEILSYEFTRPGASRAMAEHLPTMPVSSWL